MFGQDIDPLADSIPPRYAYESDEEDEFADYPVSSSVTAPEVEVKIALGNGSEAVVGQTLIIASGEVGAVWARGAKLGVQTGQVSVDKHAIGLVFRPSWVASSVIVSEALTRLPVWAMHAYAEAVLNRWKPSKVIIIDGYSTATYISAASIPYHEAPLRYLHSSFLKSDLKALSSLAPFEPPNLLQSTAAAFLSILALPPQSAKTDGFAILIPSPRAPRPTPQSFDRSESAGDEASFASLTSLSSLEGSEGWDPSVVHAAHHALQVSAGCKESMAWLEQGENNGGQAQVRRRVLEVGGSMYI
ncbi:hypothetical protein EW145_g4432 [Phellinidium pouzarii]|uniref:Proteasome assembly chaperone 1 n=1 Tax=Phellinidium pouzarii TaxID=167371 RepID=A0A4S4L3J7_9AGAM|nr:hypothetical protein EW145_g4432 [Phellinidium pouzarii]